MHIIKTSLCLLTAALLATTATLALAQTCNPNIPLTKPDSRYTYNAAGDEVTDTVTGLIWKRCVEGMNFSGGTCAGTATTFNWEAALVHAAKQSGWRLPDANEIISLEETACYDMAINETAFPATPCCAWSASPAATGGGVWYMGFLGNDESMSSPFSVRLVRGQ